MMQIRDIKVVKNIWHFCCDYIYINFFSLFFRLFPINSRKIVVCTYKGGGYSCNPRAVIEEMMPYINKNNVRVIWAIKNRNEKDSRFPKRIKLVRYKSIGYLWHLCTAKVWIDNSRKDFAPKKRRGQVYFQLWHGSIMLKKVEKDALTLPKRYIRQAILDSKNADYFISGSEYTTKKYRDTFWYKGKILEGGTPRADILVNRSKHEAIEKNIRSYFNLKDEKLLLYAPTFRADGSLRAYDLDYERLVSALRKKFGGRWKVLVRLHPNIAKKSKELGLSQNCIIDVSNYPDIEELYIVADVCVTDYSSVMFEYSYMKKPVFLYASDIDSYVDDRGFYFDIRKLPYPLAQNNDELIRNILDFSNEKYQAELKKFFEEIGLNETGRASEIVANKIIEILEKGV